MNKIIFILCIFLSFSFAENKKIVSIGGSITQTIAALGGEKSLIAVDLSSVKPESVRKLPNVGYWLKLSKEGILSLKPDIVIASEYSRPKKVLESLKEFGIKMYLIDDKFSLDSAVKKITQIGEVLSKQKEAKIITDRIEKNIKQMKKEIKPSHKKVLFLFTRGGEQFMAAGRKSHVNELIVQAGATNISDAANYRILSKESIAVLNPDIIIIGDVPHNRYDISKFKKGILKFTKASKNNNIYTMDMLLASGFGIDVDEALREMSCRVNSQKLSFCKE